MADENRTLTTPEGVRMPGAVKALSVTASVLLALFTGLICFAVLNWNLNILGVFHSLRSPALLGMLALVSLAVAGLLARWLIRSDAGRYAKLPPPAGRAMVEQLAKIAVTLVLIGGFFAAGSWMGKVEAVAGLDVGEGGGLFGWLIGALIVILPSLVVFAVVLLPEKARNLIFSIVGLLAVAGVLAYFIFFDVYTLIEMTAVIVPAAVIAIFASSSRRVVRLVALALIVVPILFFLVLNLGTLMGLLMALVGLSFSALLILVPALVIGLAASFRKNKAMRYGMMVLSAVVLVAMVFVLDYLMKATNAEASVLRDLKDAAGTFWPIYLSAPLAVPLAILVALTTRKDRRRHESRGLTA